MGLKELAQVAEGRSPHLTRHPKGKPFLINFPIIQERLKIRDGLDWELNGIIRIRPDQQGRKTNVKAGMSSWFMQDEYPQFQEVGDLAIEIAKKNSPYEMDMNLYDIWSAKYVKDDFTKFHDHWPHIWSFTYYLKFPKGSSPLIFCNGYEKEHVVTPNEGDILMWPSWIPHRVDPQPFQTERIIIAGNISPDYQPKNRRNTNFWTEEELSKKTIF